MAGNPLTQKQTTQKYGGNLGYFRRTHYLRRLRGWCFVIAAVCSLGAVASFRFWGGDEIFSAGPISENHARFANDCRACHLAPKIDFLTALLSEKPGTRTPGAVFTAATSHESATNEYRPTVHLGAVTPAAHSLMDQACLKCHQAAGLHQPRTAELVHRAVSNELTLVHAANCFVCHREHAGPGRMAPPSRQTCVSCHNSAAELRRARPSLLLKNPIVAATGENRDLGDGLVRFISPARPPRSLEPFANYAEGHPPFGYEHLRDPADLKFNHARHGREDIRIQNRRLDCGDCHNPGPGGVFYQPISYDRHCQQCHSLQIIPSLPKLLIPHGDPEKVRYFLASLSVSVESALRAKGATEPIDTDSEMRRLQQRGLDTLPGLEQRVFFEGDPKDTGNDSRRRTENRKFLTECAKCHTVSPGDAISAPKVNPPNIAERWVQRGPFTHMPHQHMACVDCHGAARASKLTSDILLPSQKLCAECHRPPGKKSLPQSDDPLRHSASFKQEGAGMSKTQRETGGIKWDCQSCHIFHAPPDAVSVLQRGAGASTQPASASVSVFSQNNW